MVSKRPVKSQNYSKAKKRKWRRMKKQLHPKFANELLSSHVSAGNLSISSTKLRYFGLVDKANEFFSALEKRAPKTKKVDLTLIKKLEEAAENVKPKDFTISTYLCEELRYFIGKYGDDFERMVQDHRNVFQFTATQFKRKIKRFRSTTKQFDEYLKIEE
ncbi:hypothetical protein ACOME3_001198 [Neoechinorhynchus agilis]